MSLHGGHLCYAGIHQGLYTCNRNEAPKEKSSATINQNKSQISAKIRSYKARD